MPYARFDDRYDDHRKIKRAWRRQPVAVALHAMAITYCNRHNTDGLVDVEWVDEKLALCSLRASQRQKVVVTLLELHLFEEHDGEHYIVHDFLDWNLSRAQRDALSQQGRRGGEAKAKATGRPAPKPPPSEGSGNGSSQGHSEGSSTPRHATPTPNNVNTNAELRSAVIEVFAYWQERCNHPQAEASEDRLAKIRARLKERQRFHSGDLHAAILDCRRAVDGAALGAFVDEKGKRHDGILLIFRNNDKVEDFMDRADPSPLRVIDGGQVERPAALRRADAWRTG